MVGEYGASTTKIPNAFFENIWVKDKRKKNTHKKSFDKTSDAIKPSYPNMTLFKEMGWVIKVQKYLSNLCYVLECEVDCHTVLLMNNQS